MPYEEIDHHADVMFHVWGTSFDSLLKESLIAMTSVFLGPASDICLAAYSHVLRWQSLQIDRLGAAWKYWMTTVAPTDEMRTYLRSEKNVFHHEFTVTSISIENLLYQVLDECLYLFATENVWCLGTKFELLDGEIGTKEVKIFKCFFKKIPAYGDSFAGIEVKAVTKHNLRVIPPLDCLKGDENRHWNAWFVLDI